METWIVIEISCWNAKANERPSFKEIFSLLESIAKELKIDVSQSYASER